MSDPLVTYNPTLATPLDRLRYLLGDVDTDAALLPDATYTAVLGLYANDERLSAIQLATGLITRYAQEATSVSLGGISASYANRIKGWQDLIARLRAELASEATLANSGFDVLRPQRADDNERAEYRRERGDVECW